VSDVDAGGVPIRGRLRAREVLISDGALGTELFARGLGAGECPENWNLAHPEILEEIARSYAEAGADFVTTNTFGGSPMKLAAYELSDRIEEINRAGVDAVRRGIARARDGAGTAPRRVYVLGSCGPCGKLLKPYGDADPDDVRAGFVAQAGILIAAGADMIAIETMTDLAEAVLAVEGVVQAAQAAFSAAEPSTAETSGGRVPIAVTMTFERTRRGFFTIMGNDIPTVATRLAAAGAEIVGSNCGTGIDDMIDVARAFRAATDLPILIQPNAGLPSLENDSLVYHETPEAFAQKSRALVNAGVAIIGGCCGTTPEHIRMLRGSIIQSA
jgi:5-methyltetrahydrofolate--homocysteine methyltransferase